MDKEDSIFNFSSKKSVPSKPAKKTDPALSDDEASKMLHQMMEMHHELKEKISGVFTQAGLSDTQIKTYLEDRSNFSSIEWNMIQAERESLSKKISNQFARKKSDKAESEKKERSRKSKTLGGRRNWMSMH